jgi:hypothetical protein
MRFMMIMFPKVYENAKPGWVPDFKDMEAMGKYNEQLQKAGVLLALDGLTPPSTMRARVTFKSGKSKVTDGPVYRNEGSGRRLLDHPGEVARRGARMGLAHPRKG